MGLCFISHLNRASMAVAGSDRIMDQYGIDPVRMGAVYSAFLVIYSILMIPGGVFIDRFGPRRALMLVGFGSAIFGAATGILGWLSLSGVALVTGMVVVRGVMGAVSAPLHPAAARAIANWFPFSERTSANGIVTAAAILGVAMAYPGFGFLIKKFDWPAAFCICAAITALLTLTWSLVATDQRAPESSAPVSRQTWLGLLGNRRLILLTLSYAAIGYFQYLFVYWMQYYFEKVLNLGADASKVYAGLLQLALAIGMPLGGWLSARMSRAVVGGGGMFLSALFLAFGVLSKEPFWIVLWFAIAHTAIGASEGPVWATAVDIGAEKGGTAAAICNTGGNVGGLLAPVLTPLISGYFGWSAGIAVGGAVCILGAIFWRWIEPRQKEL